MRVNLKKRLTALMMAGMMVTSNVLPAYSATETTASDFADRDGEAEEHTEKAEHSAEKTEEKDTSVKSSDEKTSDAKSAEQKSDDTASEEKSGKDDTASEKKDDVKEEKQDERTEEKSDSSASSDAKDTEKTDAAAKADASEKKEHASKDAEETAASEKDSTEKTDSETEAKEETTASEETAAAETTEAETKAASGGSSASGVAGTGVKIEETTASEETTEAETTAAEETTAAAETTAPVEVIEANADTASSSDIRKSLTLQVRFIDEDGNALPDRENAELSIKGDLDLTKSPRAVRGYTYVEARLGDLVLTKITRVKDAENDEVSYAYTAKDGTTGSIDDGTTLDLVYTKNDRKSIYTYIGDGIKVTAKLEKAAAIPDDASLRVVELSDGQLYDAYIAAMDEADPDLEHTKTNTILWDIAFIATDDEGQELEYEPSEGSVKVSIEYLNDTLEQKLGVSDVSEVKTYHLPLADGVKAEGEKTIDVQDVASSDINVEKLDSTADGDKTVEVEMDSFSVMAQTVDGTEYLVDDEPLDLTKIANENITVTVETTGELDRNATFDLGLSFKVDDQRLANTVKTDSGDGKVYHNVWVYDLSSVLKNAPIALVNGINGDLFDGVAKVGTYSVSDGKITLKIEPEFLAAHTSNVQGSFRFQAKLEKEKLSTEKEYTIRFPGSATDTTITVKDVNASSWKSVTEGTGDQC